MQLVLDTMIPTVVFQEIHLDHPPRRLVPDGLTASRPKWHGHHPFFAFLSNLGCRLSKRDYLNRHLHPSDTNRTQKDRDLGEIWKKEKAVNRIFSSTSKI